MDFAAELARLNPDPALLDWLNTQFAQAQNQATELARMGHLLQQQTSELKHKDLKIQALTLELAHHKRLKFGVKSEALSPEQRDLFAECSAEDGAAIVAEVEQLQGDAPRAKRKPTGRKSLPAELPRIEYRHEPTSCQCGQCGQDLVKIGEDISEQLDVTHPQGVRRGCKGLKPQQARSRPTHSARVERAIGQPWRVLICSMR